MTDLQIVCEALGIMLCREDADAICEYEHGVCHSNSSDDCVFTITPDTLTPDLAWEIETRAHVIDPLTRIYYRMITGGDNNLKWECTVHKHEPHPIYVEVTRFYEGVNDNRATALISALAKAIGGK